MLVTPGLISSGTTFVWFTQVFSALLIPYLVGLYRDDYDTDEWSNWVRVLGYFVIWANAIATGAASAFSVQMMKWPVSSTQTIALCVLGILLVTFNVMFGLQTPSLLLCSGDLSTACMEGDNSELVCPVSTTQVSGDVKRWEAFLYTFSLCVLLMSQSLTILYLVDKPSAKEPHQIVSQVPAMDNSAVVKPLDDSPGRGTEPTRGRGRGRGRGK